MTVAAAAAGTAGSAKTPTPAGALAVAAAGPVVRTIPLPRRRRQPFLKIRNRESLEVVTIVELLSPTNKGDDDGREKYLRKRRKVLSAGVNLVELDLLRGGPRLPTLEPQPGGDYFAFVCRTEDLPQVAVYPWSLRERLPDVPLPLAEDDPDAVLNLQDVFTSTFDAAGFDYTLDYGGDIVPPLNDADRQWVREVLRTAARPSVS